MSLLIKKFTCCKCLNDVDVMTNKDSNPLFLCDVCRLEETYKHHIIVELDGAPVGFVKGSRNRVTQKNPKTPFTKPE